MLTTTPQELELAPRLRLAVTRLARRLRQESGEDLTPSQSSALATIHRHGPIAPSELAERERVRRPTATRVIGALEQAGLVAREADPADGRGCRVRITEAGATVLAVMRSRKNAYLAERLLTLAPAELELLEQAAGLIERLVEEPAEPGQQAPQRTSAARRAPER
jgi:DNA-binding MarR family transcriptional regulator